MQIHVARAGKEFGAFSSDEIRAGLVSGRFLPSDFGWTEGQSDWVQLAALPGLTPIPPPAPPPQPPPEVAVGKPAPEIAVPKAAPEVVSAKPIAEPRGADPEVRSSAPVPSRPVNPRRSPIRKSRLASTSLLLGILALSMIPLLSAIPAIICGHLARWQIRRSEGRLSGDGLALGGLITGYLSLFLFGAIGALIYLIANSVHRSLPVGPG